MASGLKRFFKRESSTEEEIKQLVDEDEGELAVSQREMINNIFEFDDLNAGDIMTHRTDIVAVEDTDTLSDVAAAAIEEGCSRIPVYHEDLDNVLGIIYVKDLLKFVGREISKNEKLTDYIREPLFVPESIPIGKLFAQMTETRIQLAIVVDEYGGMSGIITVTDLVEQLVGEFSDDEDDIPQPHIEKTGENMWLIPGTATIAEVSDELDISIPADNFETFGGYVIDELGDVPREGTQIAFEADGLRVEIVAIRHHRIEACRVEKIAPQVTEPDDEEQ